MKRMIYEHEGCEHTLSTREIVTIRWIGSRGLCTRESLAMPPAAMMDAMEARGLLMHRETAPFFIGLTVDAVPVSARRQDLTGRDRYYGLTSLGQAVCLRIEESRAVQEPGRVRQPRRVQSRPR